MTSEVVTGQRPVPADTFAGRLMIARLHAGNLTIQDAAERCGLIDQSWSNWEKGRTPRNLLDVVDAISDGLDVDYDWLLFGGPLSSTRPRRMSTRQYLSRGKDRPQAATHRPPNMPGSRRPQRRHMDRIAA